MKKKEIIQISITGFLALILLFTFINSFSKMTKKRPSISAKSGDTLPGVKRYNEKEASVKPAAEDIFNRQEKAAEDLGLIRDPFTAAPIMSLGKSSSGNSLNGIIYDKDNPMAIINNRVVKIGSKIGTNIVIDIRPDSVILNDGNKDFELKLE